jgi:hypothetical protein
MTSLEGYEPERAELRRRRPSHVFECPSMTLAYPGWPSDRARNGHAVRLLPRPLSRAGLIRTIGRAWGLSSLELDKIH